MIIINLGGAGVEVSMSCFYPPAGKGDCIFPIYPHGLRNTLVRSSLCSPIIEYTLFIKTTINKVSFNVIFIYKKIEISNNLLTPIDFITY